MNPRLASVMASAPRLFVGGVWAIVPDFPNYLVGDNGTVISVTRAPRVLNPIKRGAYSGFTLADAHGRLRPVYLHRLVAEAWHGPCPPGQECRHLDGDKTNNHFRNLMWGTHQENVDDTVQHGRSLTGGKNPNAKLTAEQVAALRQVHAQTGQSYAQIARSFGISTMTAYRAIRRQSWKN